MYELNLRSSYIHTKREIDGSDFQGGRCQIETVFSSKLLSHSSIEQTG